MYLLFKMVIFQCHVSFGRVAFDNGKTKQPLLKMREKWNLDTFKAPKSLTLDVQLWWAWNKYRNLYIYIHTWNLFDLHFGGFHLPKQGLFQSKQGSFGFQVYKNWRPQMPNILFWKTKGPYPAGKKNMSPERLNFIKKDVVPSFTDMNDIIIFAGMGV